MKRNKFTIAVAVILVSLTAVSVALAQPPGGRHRGHGLPFIHLERLQDDVGLTDAQVDQIKAIMREAHEQNAQYHEQLRGGFEAILKTLLADPNNTAAAQSLIDQQAAAEKAMKANLLTAASKALNVLTAEQRAKFATILEERPQRRPR